MLKIFRKLALITPLVVLPLVGQAATQGTLGATSTGTVLISATIQDLVIITGLNDINMGIFDGTTALSGNDSFCVYRNGTGAYNATMTGTGGTTTPGFFIKHATAADEMAYTVSYSDGGAPIAATSGTTVTPLAGNATSQNCGGGTNATITVGITAVVAQAAPTGVYSGTLTILIAPI